MYNFYKAAHVRALVFMRQVHMHIDRRNRMLANVAPVKNSDRIEQVFDAYFANGNVVEVPLILNVFHNYNK